MVGSFIIRRLITGVITVFAVALLSFFIFNLLPGDPALVMLGFDADYEALATLRQQLKLDEPWVIRFGYWLSSLLTGNAGDSVTYHRPVSELLVESLPPTLSITLLSSIFTLVVSFSLGIFAVIFHHRFPDIVLTLIAQVGVVIPSFWVGILLLMVFTLKLQWFPFGQYTPMSTSFVEWLRSVFLPSVSVSLLSVSLMMRMIRASLLETLKEDYVRTARSKGLEERKVFFKHIMKNAMIPVLTLFGLQITSILSGSIIIENVFSLPGLGRLLLLSVQRRDLPVVQGIILWMAFITVLINITVDFLHTLFDPRVSL
jgi:peptide/nickel transport system permease protein